jgi:hypothetical protein
MKRRKLNDMLSAMKRISRSEIYSRTVLSDPATSGLQTRPESAAAPDEPVVESDPVTSELQARPESAAASEANSNLSVSSEYESARGVSDETSSDDDQGGSGRAKRETDFVSKAPFQKATKGIHLFYTVHRHYQLLSTFYILWDTHDSHG